jgi:hypothetical protein
MSATIKFKQTHKFFYRLSSKEAESLMSGHPRLEAMMKNHYRFTGEGNPENNTRRKEIEQWLKDNLSDGCFYVDLNPGDFKIAYSIFFFDEIDATAFKLAWFE